MPPTGARATYSGPLIFLSSGQFSHVLKCLNDRLPLRSLHWKSSSRVSVRSVQEINLNLVVLDTVRDEPSSQVPTTLLERPLLNIYFVSCEDADAYKNTVRKQIKDWHTLITQRRNQEWLIILVSKPETQATAGKSIFQRGSVLDKIKTEFNVGKRDRCVQLSWSVGSDDPAAWTDLISKMKEGVISSFDALITAREEDVKRSEIQRQMPGWNFCTFFILKESLALSFEGMGLIEDAKLQYDELEALFFQVLEEKNLSWFGQLGGTSANDDSTPLLSTTKKPYRDLILSNTITVFDFRSYLLARQCLLLARMGEIAEAAEKAARFVTSFARTLRENTQTLSHLFLESWMYSAAFSIVDQCQAWADVYAIEGHELVAFNALKGELLELARTQLDKIGIYVGHLPRAPPFTASLTMDSEPNTLTSDKLASVRISHQDLLDAISSEEAFDKIYTKTTLRAIENYISSGRKRFALKLHASLGALEYHRDNYEGAYKTFSTLPSHYVTQKWASLEGFMLSKAIDLPDRTKDGEWLNQVLAFFRAFVDQSARGYKDFAGKGDEEVGAYISQLVVGLEDCCRSLSRDHVVAQHPAISIHLVDGSVRTSGDQDGCFLYLTVENSLPCDFPLDEINATLVGRYQERLTFKTDQQLRASPGLNVVSLFCPQPASGLFSLAAAQARLGKIIFQSTFLKPTTAAQNQRTPLSKASDPTLCRISADPLALNVSIGFPREVILNSTPHLLFTISTGRNNLQKAILNFSNPGDHVVFDTSSSQLIDGESDSFVRSPKEIALKDVQAESILTLTLPYSGSNMDQMRVRIHVLYTCVETPEITRTLVRTQVVKTALPLAVNVQDYFRGSSLFSRFRISCASEQHLRVLSAHLETRASPSSFKISGCRKANGKIETISPARPAHYLFRLDSLNTKEPRQEPESLLLKVTYRSLREDVEACVTGAIKDLIPEGSDLGEHRAWLWNFIMERILEDEKWAERYSELMQVILPPISTEDWEPLAKETELEESQIQHCLRVYLEVSKVLLGSKNQRIDEAYGEWRMLSIPLDLPFMNIVNSARIEVSSGPETPIYAGQPVKARLSVTTSFRWGSPMGNTQSDQESHMPDAPESSDKPGYLLRFDVDTELGGTWLVSGPKRGDYFAVDNSTFETYVTLVPLRHGSLVLPKVAVSPVPDEVVNRSDAGGPRGYHGFELPSCETHQAHLAQRVIVLPRSARSTYVVTVPT